MPDSSIENEIFHPESNLYEEVFRYENGELDQHETVQLFQRLVDSGLVWSLQGSYGRMAVSMITAGWVTPKAPRG